MRVRGDRYDANRGSSLTALSRPTARRSLSLNSPTSASAFVTPALVPPGGRRRLGGLDGARAPPRERDAERSREQGSAIHVEHAIRAGSLTVGAGEMGVKPRRQPATPSFSVSQRPGVPCT